MTGMAQRMYTSLGPKVLHCTLEFTVELKHVISKENISFFLLMKQFKTQRQMCINNLKQQKAESRGSLFKGKLNKAKSSCVYVAML